MKNETGRTSTQVKRMKNMHTFLLGAACATLLSFAVPVQAHAQDWVRTGTNLGAQRIRLAAASFKSGTVSPQESTLKQVFDQTLFSDLQNAGIFDMVSKSMAPPLMPGSQADVQLAAWSAAPSSAEMLAFGTFSVNGGQLAVTGFLDDTKNPQSPQVLGKQYSDVATVLPMRSSSGWADCPASPKRRSCMSRPAEATRRSWRWITTGRTAVRSPISAPFLSRRISLLTIRALPSLRSAKPGGRSSCFHSS
jgi:hypothetical protein